MYLTRNVLVLSKENYFLHFHGIRPTITHTYTHPQSTLLLQNILGVAHFRTRKAVAFICNANPQVNSATIHSLSQPTASENYE